MNRFAAVLLLILPIILPAAPFVRCGFETFPPYFYSIKAKEPGFAIELIRAVLPPDKCRVEFVHAAWGPTLSTLHIHWARVRAYAGVAHGDYGARFTRFPLYTTQSAVFIRKGFFAKYENTSSLLKGKTGMIRDYSHTDELDEYSAKHASDGKIVFQSTDRNVHDLLNGKIMFLIDNIDSVYAALKRMNRKADDVILLKRLDNATPNYLIFCWHKDYVPAVNAFNDNLKKYRDTEAYYALREKYGLEKLPRPQKKPAKKSKKQQVKQILFPKTANSQKNKIPKTAPAPKQVDSAKQTPAAKK